MQLADYNIMILISTVFCAGGFLGICYELSNYRRDMSSNLRKSKKLKEDVQDMVDSNAKDMGDIKAKVEWLEVLISQRK